MAESLSEANDISAYLVSNFRKRVGVRHKYHRVVFLHISKTGGRAFEQFASSLPYVKLTKEPSKLDYLTSKMPRETVEVVTYHVNCKNTAQDVIARFADYKRNLDARGVSLWLTLAFRNPIDHFISQFRWHLKMFTGQPKRFGVVGTRKQCRENFLTTLLNFVHMYPCGGFSPQSTWLFDFIDGILRQQTDFMLFERTDALLKLYRMLDFAFMFETFTADLHFFFHYGLLLNATHFPQALPRKNANAPKSSKIRNGDELLARCPAAKTEIDKRLCFDKHVYSALMKAEQALIHGV